MVSRLLCGVFVGCVGVQMVRKAWGEKGAGRFPTTDFVGEAPSSRVAARDGARESDHADHNATTTYHVVLPFKPFGWSTKSQRKNADLDGQLRQAKQRKKATWSRAHRDDEASSGSMTLTPPPGTPASTHASHRAPGRPACLYAGAQAAARRVQGSAIHVPLGPPPAARRTSNTTPGLTMAASPFATVMYRTQPPHTLVHITTGSPSLFAVSSCDRRSGQQSKLLAPGSHLTIIPIPRLAYLPYSHGHHRHGHSRDPQAGGHRPGMEHGPGRLGPAHPPPAYQGE